jgi:hypothetical protein
VDNTKILRHRWSKSKCGVVKLIEKKVTSVESRHNSLNPHEVHVQPSLTNTFFRILTADKNKP